jgi:hypothetical protein
MQVIHLSQKELAERWRMSEATLKHWRSNRVGPVFLKIRGHVLYRHVDIEAFEVASLKGTFVEHCNDAKSVKPSALDCVNVEIHWQLVNVLPNPCCRAATSKHPKHPHQQP